VIDLARQTIRYRDLLGAFIARELRSRYRGSFFGSAWLIFQPLLYLVVYFVVFVQVLKVSIRLPGVDETFVPDHPLGLVFMKHVEQVGALSMFVGLIPWISFSETISRSLGCILANGNLIKKYAFPSQLLPVYLVGVSLFNTVVSLAVLTIFMYVLIGGLPHFVYLLPVVLLLQGMFTLGLAMLVSSVTVFVKDLQQTIPMLLTFWFFLSPIFYITKGIRSDAGAGYLWVVEWNPLRYLIEIYREMFVIYPGVSPASELGSVPWGYLGIFAVAALLSLAAGYAVFMRLRPTFADEI
jgi:ABC-type polysaccharide/polyol phosphate export permease